ncbi:MAG TPA: YciI family protein [Dehalococcoidia bacterium]|nr:YciI family protein [Dehalococcoidia bacterium]
MKYMLLLFNEEADDDMSPEAMAPWIKFGEDATKIATQHGGEALQPSATATVVSVRDGKTITTDGPFIDTKEQLGGFYIFDCKDLDDAIKLASMIPWAPTGHIEVRPIVDFG